MASSGSIDPLATVARFEALAAARKFRVERFGKIDGVPLIALCKRSPGRLPRVYLSAGIHGDEPAPPLALLRLLEEDFFGREAVWFLCPLLNPAGFSVRTRGNRAGVDLNRDYRATKSEEILAHIRWLQYQPNFDLVLCLHEDWESSGSYLYELNPHQRPSLAEPLIAAIGKKYPIEHANSIDGRPASNGVIRPDDNPAARELWPEAIYLREHHCPLVYTIETPSAHRLEDRVDAQCIAVRTAISALAR